MRSKQLALLGSVSMSVFIALGATGARAQSGPFVYVPNGTDNVSVIDTSSNTVAGSAIPVGHGSFEAAVGGDESLVYVTNDGSNTVSVINTATNTVTATIPVGTNPLGVAVSPNGATLYVDNANDNTVSVINTATNTVTATIAVGIFPVGVTVSPNGSTAYVTNASANTVSVINTATNTVTATIPDTPAYSEADLAGGGFALSYNSMTANDTRSELGARFDEASILGATPLVLRGRVAWAHDWVTNPALTAVFQSLPGASFVVNGATPPKDSALVSAGAELHLTHNWTATAKFDGEFASRAQTYAGTGTLRYSW